MGRGGSGATTTFSWRLAQAKTGRTRLADETLRRFVLELVGDLLPDLDHGDCAAAGANLLAETGANHGKTLSELYLPKRMEAALLTYLPQRQV
jgi:hypothetical protein